MPNKNIRSAKLIPEVTLGLTDAIGRAITSAFKDEFTNLSDNQKAKHYAIVCMNYAFGVTYAACKEDKGKALDIFVRNLNAITDQYE